MKRTFVSFPITDFLYVKKQLLYWASQFNVCCFLDNHHYSFNYHSYECVLGAGVDSYLSADAGNALSGLKQFCSNKEDWIFGHFGYDLKNELENLESSHADGVMFPDLFFFIPEVVVLLSDSEILVGATAANAGKLTEDIFGINPAIHPPSHVNITSRFSRKEYINTIRELQYHILRGDCYEVNFCQDFFLKKPPPIPYRFIYH